MNNHIRFFFQDIGFAMDIMVDVLLVYSIVFIFMYASFTLLASVFLSVSKKTPNAVGLPVIFLLTLAAFFTQPGELAKELVTRAVEFFMSDPAQINLLHKTLTFGWLIGFMLSLAVLGIRYFSLQKMFAEFETADDDPSFIKALKTLGLKRKVVLKTGGPDMPAASWGLIKPCVVTPAGFRAQYSEEEREGIYLHEFMHIKNHDALKYLLTALCASLFWFNPLIRHALDRYKNHLEIICDRRVIATGSISALDYSRLMAKTISARNELLAGFSRGHDDMVRRLGYIFHDRKLLPTGKDRLLSLLCLIGLAVCFNLANLKEPTPIQGAPKGGDYFITVAPTGEPVITHVEFFWVGGLGTYSVTKASRLIQWSDDGRD